MSTKLPSLHSIFLRMVMIKLITPSLILGLVLIGVSIFYNITVIQHEQEILAKFISSEINNFLNDTTRSIRAIANTAEFVDQKSTNQQLATAFESDPYFHSFVVLDEEKRLISFFPPEAFPITAIVGRLPIFEFSDNSVSPISQPFYSSLPGKPTAFITAHLDQGGWLIGEIIFDEVERIIDNRPAQFPNRRIFLTDRQGNILISSEKSKHIPNNALVVTDIFPSPTNNSALSIFQGNLAFSNIEDISQSGWQIRIFFPVFDAIGNFVISASILIGILLLVWSLVLVEMRRNFTRRIYAPLAQFNQYINTLAQGQTTESTRPIHYPAPFIEIKNLSESFEEMSAVISQRQQALQENEQKYRLLIDESADAIYLEQDGHFVVLNQRFTELFGDFSQSSGLASGIHLLAAPADQVFVQEQQLRLLNGEVSSLRFEFKAMNKSKHVIDVEVATTSFLYRNKLAIQGIIRDITERKQMEQSEREQRNLAEALRDTASVLTSTLNISEVIDRILNYIGKVVPCYALNIMLVNEESHIASVIASKGYAERGVEDWLALISLPIASTQLLQQMYETGQPCVVPDTHHNQEWKVLEETNWIASYAGAPIKVQGKVIGFINLDSPDVNFFSPDQAERLQTFANQAGIAIHNAQLLQGLKSSNQELIAAYETTLQGWSKALELRDYETQGHTLRVLNLTIRLATRLGITEPQITHMRYGVLLHDIGKISITDNILFKKGPLTSHEWEIMRQHPSYAYEMLSPIKYLENSLDIPYYHHEWWDGTGYPKGLKGEDIPLAARIFSVVDVWDALTSDRPYHEGMSEEQAIEHLLEQAGTQLDPEIVKSFIEMLRNDLTIELFPKEQE